MEEKNRRVYQVNVALSARELAQLDGLRHSVPRAVFLRQAALTCDVPRPIPKVNQTQYQETARWAANLNQIARGLNQGLDIDIAEIQTILSAFRTSLLGLTGGNNRNG